MCTRILRTITWSGVLALLGLIPLVYFVYAPRDKDLSYPFYDFSMGLLALSVLVVWFQLIRGAGMVAAITPEGLSFAKNRPFGLRFVASCRWDELKAVEVLRVHKWWYFSSRRLVSIRLRNDESFADFPLKRIPQRISDQFIETLRHHWPDLDSPWRAQLAKRKAMDSSAR